VFIIGIVLFEVGSAICGAAPNIDTLIAGRAICGVGGSGMYVGVLTLLSMTTTEKERALYMGFPGITWGIGTVLGPIIGGAFAESSATWRWGVSEGDLRRQYTWLTTRSSTSIFASALSLLRYTCSWYHPKTLDLKRTFKAELATLTSLASCFLQAQQHRFFLR
jgi:MFS family permease